MVQHCAVGGRETGLAGTLKGATRSSISSQCKSTESSSCPRGVVTGGTYRYVSSQMVGQAGDIKLEEGIYPERTREPVFKHSCLPQAHLSESFLKPLCSALFSVMRQWDQRDRRPDSCRRN